MNVSTEADNLLEYPIIFVGNLPMTITSSRLSNIFITFGEIKNLDVVVDTSKSKSHAFIEYEEYDDCVHAIDNMDGSEIEKRVIKVSFSKSKSVSNTQRPIWMEESYYTKFSQQKEGVVTNDTIKLS